jgi:hypothetical protein
MWNKRIALIAGSVAVAVAGGAPTVAAGAADERAGCLGSLSSFGGPNHLRAPIQHFLNATLDQGAFISRAAKAHLGSDPACAEFAFGE